MAGVLWGEGGGGGREGRDGDGTESRFCFFFLFLVLFFVCLFWWCVLAEDKQRENSTGCVIVALVTLTVT